jgi:phospholipid-binding lipoprotein MlaA
VRKSPYLMVPFLPPTTARDLLGTTVNYSVLSVWPYIRPAWIPWTAYGIDLVSTRASYLSADQLIDQAFDPYLFVRDAYLQSRQRKIEKVLHPNATNENLESSTIISDDGLGPTATTPTDAGAGATAPSSSDNGITPETAAKTPDAKESTSEKKVETEATVK